MAAILAKLSSSLLLLALLALRQATCEWWYLGLKLKQLKSTNQDLSPLFNARGLLLLNVSTSALNQENGVPNISDFCDNEEVFLAPQQRDTCNEYPSLVQTFARASELAIDACIHEFRDLPWNCTVFNRTDVYGHVLELRNRETAFIYAINAAATVYQIVKDCASARLKNCSCEFYSARAETEPCDSVTFARGMSREFLHAQENVSLYADDHNIVRRFEQGIMNIYNYEAGRLIASRIIQTENHCLDKPCRLNVKLPDFGRISRELKREYERAYKIPGSRAVKRFKAWSDLIANTSAQLGQPGAAAVPGPDVAMLAYLTDSPDYCEANAKLELPGIAKRLVGSTSSASNASSSSSSSSSPEDEAVQARCDALCCRRGCHQVLSTSMRECDCSVNLWELIKFNCKQCKILTRSYYCN